MCLYWKLGKLPFKGSGDVSSSVTSHKEALDCQEILKTQYLTEPTLSFLYSTIMSDVAVPVRYNMICLRDRFDSLTWTCVYICLKNQKNSISCCSLLLWQEPSAPSWLSPEEGVQVVSAVGSLFFRQPLGTWRQQLHHWESCTQCTFGPSVHTHGSLCTFTREGFKATLGCVLIGPGINVCDQTKLLMQQFKVQAQDTVAHNIDALIGC